MMGKKKGRLKDIDDNKRGRWVLRRGGRRGPPRKKGISGRKGSSEDGEEGIEVVRRKGRGCIRKKRGKRLVQEAENPFTQRGWEQMRRVADGVNEKFLGKGFSSWSRKGGNKRGVIRKRRDK